MFVGFHLIILWFYFSFVFRFQTFSTFRNEKAIRMCYVFNSFNRQVNKFQFQINNFVLSALCAQHGRERDSS